MLIFTYGILLDRSYMVELGAKPVGVAMLIDHRLEFRTHATVVPCAGCSVPGAVYDVDDSLIDELDMIEGSPSYYRKHVVSVDLDGRLVDVLAYKMVRPHHGDRMPSQDYLNRIINGYRQWRIDPTHLNVWRSR
jgi:gamma-glutamylcyclotransferase (GGCT)/AIG2-like uncharacterized protein YtfP